MSYYIRPGVRTTDVIMQVIEDLDPFTGDLILDITSGVRTPDEQLSIIGKYAAVQGVSFPEYEAGNLYEKVLVPYREKDVYRWQRVWSALLNRGIIINPPLAAEVLDDYFRDGVNRLGQTIPGSPHYGGKAFDISGRPGLEKIVGVLATAKLAGVGIKGWLVERNNNAVHVDCV